MYNHGYIPIISASGGNYSFKQMVRVWDAFNRQILMKLNQVKPCSHYV